jgi:RimJ/RimL family protein N-acetyltransferase
MTGFMLIYQNMKKTIKPTLKLIDNSDVRFLYNLLKERHPKTFISHKKVPTYEEHVSFVKSRPYSRWYIITHKRKKIGSIYLTKQNEVGIFLRRGLGGKGIGTLALKTMMEKNPGLRYLANISPKNKESIRFFKKSRFKLIQYTYELIGSEST